MANGFAYDYYQNRIYSSSNSRVASTTSSYKIGNLNSSTYSQSNANVNVIGLSSYGNGSSSSYTYKNGYISGISSTIVNSSSNSISTAEKKIVCIPSKSFKIISEFNIKNDLFRSCELLLAPGEKDTNCLTYTKDESPYTFGNILMYSIGDSKDLIKIINSFYVSSITNYSITKITKLVSQHDCGKKMANVPPRRVFIQSGPDQFYIEYNPMSYTRNH